VIRKNIMPLVFPMLLLLASASASAEEVAPCGKGSIKIGKVVSVYGDNHVLRSAPSMSGRKLINMKASETLRQKVYMVVDSSTTVVQECTKGEWSRVQMNTPEWLKGHVGWVKTSALHLSYR
jgi:hypothetical protein